MRHDSPFRPLRDRRVFEWTLAYAAGAWLAFQVLGVFSDSLDLSAALLRGVHALLILGFLVTVVLAWHHGEKGRQKASGAEILLLAALMLIAGIVLAVLRPHR